MVLRPYLSALALSLLLLLPVRTQATPPADGWVIWQSNRSDSRYEVYRARADGSDVTRLTKTGGTVPMWAPDGRWISYKDDSGTVFLMRPDGSGQQELAVGASVIPFWLHDNSGLAIQQGSQFRLFDPETKESTLLFELADFPAFADGSATFLWNALTHDNRYLLAGSSLYENGYTGANGSFKSTTGFSAVIVDLLHKEKVYFFGSGCWPFSPPAGDLVFHVCGDCPTFPDIYHMSLSDLLTRASYAPEIAVADNDWGHEYNPRVSNDNRWLVYMASDGCHDSAGCDYDIWLHEIGKGTSERSRVAKNSNNDAYPSIYVGPFWQPALEPRLLVTPNRITFFASMTTTPSAKTLKLKNTGTGTLNPMTISITPASSWLRTTLGSNEVTVGLGDLSSLARGTYQTTITITVEGALNSPATVAVTLIADDSFPLREAGVPEAGVPEAGTPDVDLIGIDGGLPDVDLIGIDGGPTDANLIDSNPGMKDSGSPDAGNNKKDSGCGCHLGSPRHVKGIWTLALAGLALLALPLRRRGD